MDTINTTVADPNFFRGVLVMGTLMLILMVYAGYMRAQTLYLTAKNKGREKIGGNFYYIVEESEYNQLTLSTLPQFGQDKQVVAQPLLEEDGQSMMSYQDMVPYVLSTTRYGTTEYYHGSEHNRYSTDIRKAKFYWFIEEAEKEQDQFRLLYPLDSKKRVYVQRLDQLDTDEVALAALKAFARKQFAEQLAQD